MSKFVNGMSAADISATFSAEQSGGQSGPNWRKSSRSGPVGNCVELANLGTGELAVRNSRHPDGPALVYTTEELAAFVAGAKNGEFDDLLA